MELNDVIIADHTIQNNILQYTVFYGFWHLKQLTVWTTDIEIATRISSAHINEYNINMRVDRETNEILGVW